MNRRKAIQQIGIFALSAKYFASCDFSKPPKDILNTDQKQFLQAFSNIILPIDKSQFETPDTITDFIITIVKECKSSDEITSFQNGLAAIQKSAKVNLKDIANPTQSDINTWIAALLKSEDKSILSTLETVKSLSIEHLVTSESYLKTYTNYEFVPGRFNGCVEL